MNNKGFAITTMLYGVFLLFLILLLIMVGMLNTFKKNMDLLIDGNNGAREIVEKKCSEFVGEPLENGKYSFANRKDTSLNESQFEKILSLCGYQKG